MGALFWSGLFAACGGTPEPEPDIPLGMREVYRQDFWDAGAVGEFWRTDPDHWEVQWREPVDRGSLVPPGPATWMAVVHRTDRPPFDYRPTFRSPFRMAIVHGFAVGDFVLEVDVQSTGRPYPGRDVVLVFGFEGPERFAYVQLATLPDERTHNLFVVDHADARRVGAVEEAGMPWTDGAWHRLRLERRVADGLVRVTLDDFPDPLIELTDTTFPLGHVGIGTYDDTARFGRMRILAPNTTPPLQTTNPFTPNR